jgi:phospholipid transport system substrate-binding protein
MRISETRRRVLGLVAALAVAPRAAWATPEARAAALVAALSAELIGLLRSGRSEARLYGDFESLLARYGDMPVVAASVLGPPWRGASGPQRAAFVAAFQGHLSRKYGRQFRDYQNAAIEIRRARDAGRSGVLVETVVSRPGREGFVVEWQVSERGGQPKVVNLIIEGVSMLTNERAEVGAMLESEGGSLDRLIARMRAAT